MGTVINPVISSSGCLLTSTVKQHLWWGYIKYHTIRIMWWLTVYMYVFYLTSFLFLWCIFFSFYCIADVILLLIAMLSVWNWIMKISKNINTKQKKLWWGVCYGGHCHRSTPVSLFYCGKWTIHSSPMNKWDFCMILLFGSGYLNDLAVKKKKKWNCIKGQVFG